MKQKGIGAAAVIVIIIVIAAIGAGAYFLVSGGEEGAEGEGGGVAGLPKYAGATKADTVAGGTTSTLMSGVFGKGQSVSSGIEYEVYTTPENTSVSDVLSYYRTEMASDGWTKIYDNTLSYSWGTISCSYGFLYFEKGSRAAAAGAVSYTYENESYFYCGLMEGPKTTFEGWISNVGYYEWDEEEGEGTGGWTALSGISSIDFTMDWSYSYSGIDYEGTWRYRGRDLDTSTPDLRVDSTTYGATISYILDGDTETGYVRTSQYGDWITFASSDTYDYSTEWDSWSSGLADYYDYIDADDLSWTYSYGGYTYSYEITNVDTSPSFSSDVFSPT
jgi:hypothetical protein